MDRLLNIDGGQKLRAKDWKMIQDVTQESLRSIVQGLRGSASAVIIQGLDPVYGDESVSFTDGFVFIDGEIFYVPSDNLEWNETYVFYLTPSFTTGEARVFKDNSTHDVYSYRRYSIDCNTSIPDGSIPLPGQNLIGAISSYVLGRVPAPAEQLVKFTSQTYTGAVLYNAQLLIGAPGAGKAIKVLGITARIVPSSRLEVGNQYLKILHVEDEVSETIGTFPNTFVESSVSRMEDMVPAPAGIIINSAVKVQLSAATSGSGSASIKFYCYYVIVTI